MIAKEIMRFLRISCIFIIFTSTPTCKCSPNAHEVSTNVNALIINEIANLRNEMNGKFNEIQEIIDTELLPMRIGVYILLATVFLISFLSINIVLKMLCTKSPSEKKKNTVELRKTRPMTTIENNLYGKYNSDVPKSIDSGEYETPLDIDENIYNEADEKIYNELDEKAYEKPKTKSLIKMYQEPIKIAPNAEECTYEEIKHPEPYYLNEGVSKM